MSMTEVPIKVEFASRDDLERFSHALADVLCWARGFMAGLGEDRQEHAPIGIETLRDLNIKFKRRLDEADTEGLPEPPEAYAIEPAFVVREAVKNFGGSNEWLRKKSDAMQERKMRASALKGWKTRRARVKAMKRTPK